MMKKIAILTAIGVLLSALYLFASMPEHVARLQASGSERRIDTGLLVGYSDRNDTHAWRGIPYAKAPVGDLRWKAPRSPEPWNGTREALADGSPCVQFWSFISGMENGVEGQLLGSEDCLYLNVWAPQMTQEEATQQSKKLPVMMWIPGGGNIFGTASTYAAHHLAGSQKVIVVALNYRLGVLGWFGHPALRSIAESLPDASGNFGTLDIIQGLTWVKNNISAFGGDPDNVTIFGESAGGQNVFSLIGSEPASGLFHRAIVQSGYMTTTPRSAAENFIDDESPGLALSSREIINHLLIFDGQAPDRATAKSLQQGMSGAEIVKLLSSRTKEQLFAYPGTLAPGQIDYQTPMLLRDGFVLPKQHLLQRFTNTELYNSVPVMLGSNLDESKLIMAEDPQHVTNLLGLIPQIIDEEAYDRQAAYQSQQWKAYAVDEPASVLHQSQGNNVFAYRFDWDEAPSGWLLDFQKLLGAAHGVEIDFVFGDFESGFPFDMLYDDQNAPGRNKLSQSMMDYWGEFAYRGRPGTGVSGKNNLWLPWGSTEGDFNVLDTHSGGGIRMSRESLDNKKIKQQLVSDTSIESQEELCRLYVLLFANPEQNVNLWNSEEYENLGAQGCANYPRNEISMYN